MRWLSDLIGSPDDSLLANGELARGHILGVSASSMSMSVMNGLRERTCTFAVQVYREGHEPYQATAVQRVQEVSIPQFASGRAWVAVRVDPANPSSVALDFSTAPPEVHEPSSSARSRSSTAPSRRIRPRSATPCPRPRCPTPREASD